MITFRLHSLTVSFQRLKIRRWTIFSPNKLWRSSYFFCQTRGPRPFFGGGAPSPEIGVMASPVYQPIEPMRPPPRPGRGIGTRKPWRVWPYLFESYGVWPWDKKTLLRLHFGVFFFFWNCELLSAVTWICPSQVLWNLVYWHIGGYYPLSNHSSWRGVAA